MRVPPRPGPSFPPHRPSHNRREGVTRVGSRFLTLELRNRTLQPPTMPRDDNPPPTPTPIVCSGAIRERDPPKYNGTDEQDVDDWLAAFERVSTRNNWDNRLKLNNVEYSLTGLAEKWFLNNAARLETWPEFKADFQAVFGRPAVRKLRSEQRLRERAQKSGENFISYIEDVVDLCRRIDSAMPETDKIKHILKGIEDDAFQMLLAKNPQTVAEVVTICQSFDELRRQRALTRRPVVQDQFMSSLAANDSDGTLFQRIQQFVREEVARQLSLMPNVPERKSSLSPDLRTIVQQQVAQSLPTALQSTPVVVAPVPYSDATPTAPVTTTLAYADSIPSMPMAAPPTFLDSVPRRPYAEVAARYIHQSPVFLQPRVPVRPPVCSGPQLTNPWRTLDNRPICFACRAPGHVARYCRRSMTTGRNPATAYSYAPSQLIQEGAAYSPVTSMPSESRDFAGRRSSSPRRRSLSPMRRRPTPTQAEN